MAKFKLIFLGFILICLLMMSSAQPLIAGAQAGGNTSNQSTQVDVINTDWQNDQSIPEVYQLIVENDLFQLHVDKTSLGFIVVDRRSGYVWHSNLDQMIDGDRLNKSWKAFAQSGISIDYLDAKAVSKRISIANSNHTLDVKTVDQGIEALLTFSDFGITIGVNITLEADGVRVDVPFESIKQDSPDYKLGSLYLYPFFGATRADTVPGYMFIPDGSGALIRFSSETKATNMFYGKYYGPNLGMITEIPWDPTINRPYQISIPVFGMVHGYKQNAFIAVVEKGASYGEIQAHPSGIITNFNFLYNLFTYNEAYFQATNRSGAGVTILQRDTNAFDVSVHYRFLTPDDSDYVGMAKSYQRYLLEKGMLNKVTTLSNDVGIRLEFLGGDMKKVLVWYRLIPMTTIKQMTEILTDLRFTNVDVIYYGWQPLGAAKMPPKTLRLDSGLGSLDELRTLIDMINTGGGRFYLYVDPQAAIVNTSGYSTRNDLVMSITDSNLFGFNRGKANYFLNSDSLERRYSSLSQDVFSKTNAGLALDSIGSLVFSDFKANNFMNREDYIQAYRNLMTENLGNTSFYLPNDYMFQFMKAYYDMPLTDSGYLYTTDAVPFLQIVLSGYVPYYGSALNFSSNIQDDLLRSVDFGSYPSYFLTNEVTAKILNTHSYWIYTSSYNQWSQDIKQTYQWMNNLLGPVMGQEIVARRVLVDGVIAVTYKNGKNIIVNYNAEPYSTGDLVINGKDAVITEVLP